jgi:hypothetical protein
MGLERSSRGCLSGIESAGPSREKGADSFNPTRGHRSKSLRAWLPTERRER